MLKGDPEPLPYNKKTLPKRVEPKPEITEEFNLFDINSFADLQKKAKKNRIKNLEKKRQKIEKELNILHSRHKNSPFYVAQAVVLRHNGFVYILDFFRKVTFIEGGCNLRTLVSCGLSLSWVTQNGIKDIAEPFLCFVFPTIVAFYQHTIQTGILSAKQGQTVGCGLDVC